MAGIDLKVTSISYHQSTGKFQVMTKTPLHIGEKYLNTEMEKFLNEHYRPKVIKAFNELKTIRSKNNLQDINQVLNSVVKIFETNKKVPIPGMSGNVELAFNPDKKTKLKLNEWNTEIRAGDRISAGMQFRKDKNGLIIRGVEVSSHKGVMISGKTRFPEIASVTFHNLRADQHGVKFDYEIGAEQVLTGFAILMNVVQSYAGHPRDMLSDCDPIRLAYIRRQIDSNLASQISTLIRNNYQTLAKGGVSKEVLAAFQ